MPESPKLYHLNDPEELFLVEQALSKLSASLTRDLAAGPDKKRHARRIAANIVLAHFREAGHQIVRPWRDVDEHWEIKPKRWRVQE